MKKTFEVIITKEIEVDIPDELLTEEALEEFNAMITAGSTWEDYWKHAAQYVARLDHSFVEGIGQIGYTELYEEVEVNEYGVY